MENYEISNLILTQDLTQFQVSQIVKALLFKKYITKVIYPSTKESILLKDLLLTFWDYDNSPYIKEKKALGQSIHKRYVTIMRQRAIKYWISSIGDIEIGLLQTNHIKKVMYELINQSTLSTETINQVVRCITCPLKWAYKNGYIKKDITAPIMYCHVVSKERKIPTMEEAVRIVNSVWQDQSYRIANILAMYTGMRMGEVQALQIKDIDIDNKCIHVRHNWARSEGLKLPKNGTQRTIPVPEEVIDLLLKQIDKNPYGADNDDFVFYGYDKQHPANGRHWNESLHRILKDMDIPDYKDITFHSWRHFYATVMADCTDYRKVQIVTGHKSQKIFEHYAAHQTQETINEIRYNMESKLGNILRN